MRVPGTLFALTICLLSGAAASPQSRHGAPTSSATPSSQCQHPRSYVAVDRPDRSVAPRKLTELPPATAYMAVYREIAGCDAPLTMAKYRRSRGQ